MFRNKATGGNESDNGFGCLFYGGLLTDSEVDTLSNIIHDYAVAVDINNEWWTDTLADFDFEGSTYKENGNWLAAAGTPDPNYAIAPIAGTQSLEIDVSERAGLSIPMYSGNISVYFKIRFTDATPGANTEYVFLKNGATALAYLKLYTTGRTLLTSGGKTSYGTTVKSDATVYNIWVDYVVGVGSNSSCSVYLSLTDTKPETPECIITEGSATLKPNYIEFYSNVNHAQYVVDDLLITE